MKMKHASHPAIIKRLKRAEGHIASVIGMFEDERAALTLRSNSTRWRMPWPTPSAN